MTPRFMPNHLPALFIGTAFTLGGVLPLFRPERAILEYGLPLRIARSSEAQMLMQIGMARTTCIGAAIFTFYLQGKLEAVDTLLVMMGYLGAGDMYFCWKEGAPVWGTFKAFCGAAFMAWGWFGMTAWA
ncbi:hypothetical protein P153DRAFT_365830 [Dothidotthia symphoricarpi CBS 119687]|uniref:Uncharacterized protein n=1 Tax=Dothidotthia symphoricarpi CBS 119687 TaxID=1392245 RepID=A0A6A6AGE0_9PLEO|nr:uncharacterized protein P153DRAFT_365830 [Dothidotthia symphoricarpi CBS 119687]KAF2130185.1 hypothetical protein P153DRAFT_365830 [Dothidotthia symphoricarpi CBS 119687]